jgi:cellulose synthase/poly-beta-1,6-N-acetylglucosamine synthase-like glycosyltransferase
MTHFVFWISIATVVYVYLGYPALLRLGAFGRRHTFGTEPVGGGLSNGNHAVEMPLVSVIVAAHNEEAVIEAKIANVLASDYPRERLEILIGSDGSSDATEEIVRRHAADGVGLVSFPKQQGKSAIQNGLVTVASGSVLAFTDADCLCEPSALRQMVERFSDPCVGLVTASPVYTNGCESSIVENESTYLKYESWIREQESMRGLLAMASGSLFAVRRSSWAPLNRNLGDDFELPLRTVRAKLKVVNEPRATVKTHLSQRTPSEMFRLKVRIITKDFRALLAYRELLNPLKFGAVALALCSHKLLRWLVPYFLIVMFVSNLFLLGAPVYRGVFLAQCAFYGLAVVGFAISRSNAISLVSIPRSFCLVNFAALVGTWRLFTRQASGQWTPVRKPSSAI